MTTEKVKEVQEYLETKGIDVAETSIIDAAIRIATHRDGNAVFISEFGNEELKDATL
jgi:hypothetical protein